MRFAACFLLLAFVSPVVAQDLYAITGAGGTQSVLFRINPTNGQVIQTIGALGTQHVTALAFNPLTGRLYGHISDNPTLSQLIEINPTNGSYSVIGTTSQQIPDMSFRADGTLYGWSKSNTLIPAQDDLYRLDLNSAVATLVGETTHVSAQVGLSFAPNGTLYFKDGNTLYTLDPNTGLPTFALNLTPSGGTSALVNALAFNNDGTPFSVRRTGTTQSFLMTFDMNTGAVSTIGQIALGGQPVGGISALAFAPAAVPEPTTLVLTGIAGAGLLVGYRRRLQSELIAFKWAARTKE